MTGREIAVAFLLVLAVFLVTCGGTGDDDDGSPADDDADDDSGDDDSGDDDTGDDDGPTRPFYMAAAPYQYEFEEFAVRDAFDTAGFTGRVDALSLHMDFFGLPWEAFASGGDLPPAWTAKMGELKTLADDLGAAVFLSITPLNGMRDGLAPIVRDMGSELVQEPFGETCHDLATGPQAASLRAAYVAYARWMADFFEPAFLAHVIEIDLYDLSCPAAYAPLKDLANEAYAAVKADHPDLPVFPTFTMAHLWGLGEGGCEPGDRACLAQQLERSEDVDRDRFGISAYPMFEQYNWEWVPEDFFSAVHDLTGERLVWGETGYGTRNVVVPFPTVDDPCTDLFSLSDDDQIRFMEFLFEDAQRLGSDLVTWWSLRDFVPASMPGTCPCDAPGLWCVLYDAVGDAGLLPLWLGWGSMGIMDYELADKPGAATWDAWFARRRVPVE
jgi:hypothetical protein